LFGTSFSSRTTDNLSEGASNKYYSDTLFGTSFSSRTTDNLTEGNSKLYLTTERVQDIVAGFLVNSDTTTVTKTYVDDEDKLTLDVAVDNSSIEKDSVNKYIQVKADGIGATKIASNVDMSSKNFNSAKVGGKTVDDTKITTDYLWTANKTKTYVDDLLKGLDWQESVKNIVNDPPTPSNGDRYIVGTEPTGVFVGHENAIAVYVTDAWTYIVPDKGTTLSVEETGVMYTYNTAWVAFGAVVSHNALGGIQGGISTKYYHLSDTQHSGLTGGSDTTLHSHGTVYYTETEIDNFFEGASGGKKQVSFANITNAPLKVNRTNEVQHVITTDQSWSVISPYNSSSGDTLTELFLNGLDERFILATNSAVSFDGLVQGADFTHSKFGTFKISGMISNITGTVAIIEDVIVEEVSSTDETWEVTATADNATKTLKFNVKGASGDTIKWNSKINILEIK